MNLPPLFYCFSALSAGWGIENARSAGVMTAESDKMCIRDRVESERPYFYKTQVEKVEAIKRFLTEHVAENFTQEELLQMCIRDSIPTAHVQKALSAGRISRNLDRSKKVTQPSGAATPAEQRRA